MIPGGAKRLVPGLAAACLVVLSLLKPVCAQEAAPPSFWEPRERLTRPDLSAVTRLRFLTAGDFPPFNSLDEKGRLSGFNIDLARAICAELALAGACEVQAVPWNELQPALEKGAGEAILAGVAVTAQSRLTYAFSRPYLRLPGRFVTSRRDRAEEPLWRALEEATVGVVAGSAHEKFLRERFSGIAVQAYPGAAPMLEALQAGRIRAAFGDGMRLSFWLNGGEGACCRFAGGPYYAPAYFGAGLAIATRPGNAVLVEALNYALFEIAAGKQFTEISLRWFPVSFF